jgi:hypothetical protein
MKRLITLSLLTLLIGFSSCKNKEKSVDTDASNTEALGTPGQDLSKPILILDSEPENWVTLTEAEGSEGRDYSTGPVYLNKVSRVVFKGRFGLLVEGNFPDGCSTLHAASAVVESDVVQLTLSSRKGVNQMCTQALVPFVYFLDSVDDEAYPHIERWVFGNEKGIIE